MSLHTIQNTSKIQAHETSLKNGRSGHAHPHGLSVLIDEPGRVPSKAQTYDGAHALDPLSTTEVQRATGAVSLFAGRQGFEGRLRFNTVTLSVSAGEQVQPVLAVMATCSTSTYPRPSSASAACCSNPCAFCMTLGALRPIALSCLAAGTRQGSIPRLEQGPRATARPGGAVHHPSARRESGIRGGCAPQR